MLLYPDDFSFAIDGIFSLRLTVIGNDQFVMTRVAATAVVTIPINARYYITIFAIVEVIAVGHFIISTAREYYVRFGTHDSRIFIL